MDLQSADVANRFRDFSAVAAPPIRIVKALQRHDPRSTAHGVVDVDRVTHHGETIALTLALRVRRASMLVRSEDNFSRLALTSPSAILKFMA